MKTPGTPQPRCAALASSSIMAAKSSKLHSADASASYAYSQQQIAPALRLAERGDRQFKEVASVPAVPGDKDNMKAVVPDVHAPLAACCRPDEERVLVVLILHLRDLKAVDHVMCAPIVACASCALVLLYTSHARCQQEKSNIV